MSVYCLAIEVRFEGLTLDVVTVDESNFSVDNQKFCVEGAQQNLVEVLSIISAMSCYVPCRIASLLLPCPILLCLPLPEGQVVSSHYGVQAHGHSTAAPMIHDHT